MKPQKFRRKQRTLDEKNVKFLLKIPEGFPAIQKGIRKRCEERREMNEADMVVKVTEKKGFWRAKRTHWGGGEGKWRSVWPKKLGDYGPN